MECPQFGRQITPADCFKVRAVVLMKLYSPSTLGHVIEDLDEAYDICDACQYANGSGFD